MSNDFLHNEILLAIGNLQGEVKSGFASVNKGLDEVKETAKGHDTRIREVENQQSVQAGKFAAYGGIGGMVSSVFIWFITNRIL